MRSWNEKLDQQIMQLRQSMTYGQIAAFVGRTETSVKHRIRRIQQSLNQDRYVHTAEKTDQFKRVWNFKDNAKILEMNCGYGGMTEVYSSYGEVESYDIDKKRVDFVNTLGMENVTAIKADSENEINRLSYFGCHYDVVDIDPYGFPSRYFPTVFGLIKNGLLFVTFPKMGVAQINKITIRHYEAFWDIQLSDKNIYIDKIKKKLVDYAFMQKRSVEFLDVMDLGRVYRIAMMVKKESSCDLVGLVVNRGEK